jgi:DNA modification methylase
LQPIFLQRGSDRIVAGHGRFEVMTQRLKMEEVPVVRLDLTDAQAAAYALVDNRATELGGWEDEVLKELLKGVQIDLPELDMTKLGFSDELREILKDKGVTEDESPPLPEAATAKRGDVYALGEHRLMCGDCLNKEEMGALMDGKRADMAFTDPPYGVDYDATASGRGAKKYRAIENDNLVGSAFNVFCEMFLRSLQEHSDSCASFYICFANRTQHHLLNAAELVKMHYAVPVVWNKGHAAITWDRYHAQHEMIFYMGEGSKPTGKSSRWYGPNNETTVWDVPRDPNKEYVHPTQKPVALGVRAIINSSRKGDVVLDIFGGSGSTLMACEATGRRCFMMELDPLYISVIIERWKKSVGKEAYRINKDGTKTAWSALK